MNNIQQLQSEQLQTFRGCYSAPEPSTRKHRSGNAYNKTYVRGGGRLKIASAVSESYRYNLVQ
eukprot:2688145-Pleurochrysis_carterae.AAC.1